MFTSYLLAICFPSFESGLLFTDLFDFLLVSSFNSVTFFFLDVNPLADSW